MSEPVEIEFACLPLRSVARFDAPLDAADEELAQMQRIREAAERYGTHNTYYLYGGRCAFRTTNDAELGRIEYRFEGVALTDQADLRTQRCELHVEFASAVCDWITPAVVAWFEESVREAVRVEFDRYIAAGDLARTVDRIARLEAEVNARGGFLGLDI